MGRGAGSDERIRRQAELLTAARLPGVVEVVGVEGSAERPVLVTALVDGPTLAAPMPLTVEEVAGLVADVASTLAELHEMGIVHGAVVPEHVLLAPDGRTVLCGFGSAGRVGETGPTSDHELHPATDVASLGRILRRLATGPDARALRRVAEAATGDDPAARPSARAMAEVLTAAVPGARLPVPGAGGAHDRAPGHDLRSLVADARPDRRRAAFRRRPSPMAADSARRRWPLASSTRGGRLPVLAAALAGAVGLLLLAPWASPGRSGPRPAPTAAAPPSSRPAPQSTAVVPPSTTLPGGRTGCPAPTSVLVADIDGDGCLDALDYADGVLEAAGVRWALGQAGDQLAIGDWSCRGTRTIVLLRPATGEVFRFEAWALGVDVAVTAPAVATVPGGMNVRAADVDRDGCHELVVERGELPPQVVRFPRARP